MLIIGQNIYAQHVSQSSTECRLSNHPLFVSFLYSSIQLTTKALRQFHLSPYRDCLVRDLSGGNQRKLSVAVTCIGDTSLVLMDEPTSDMDPVTRHLTYDCIRQLLRADRAVILTSHTITEIDGVCGRIAILRRGRLVSMGSTLALQSMYGLCYAVRVFGGGGGEAAVRALERELRERLAPVGMESVQVEAACGADDGEMGGGGGGSVQFVVRIGRSDANTMAAGEVGVDAVEPSEEAQRALRLSELCELLHRFAMEHSCTYSLAECLLDQVY